MESAICSQIRLQLQSPGELGKTIKSCLGPRDSAVSGQSACCGLGVRRSRQVHQSAWAAITYHRLGGLNNRTLFLTLVEAGKFKMKVQAG